MDSNLLLQPYILGSLGFIALYLLVTTIQARSLPKSIPIVGRKEGEFLADFRARFRNLTSLLSFVEEGYSKYSKPSSKTFAVPSWARPQPEVIIPQEHITWLLRQPEEVLSHKILPLENLAARYVTPSQQVITTFFHEEVIKRDLTRNLEKLTSDIIDELSTSITDEWGTDTENWREVCVYDTMQEIIARTSNRVFVGLPLCRDKGYLEACKSYAQSVSVTGNLIVLILPTFLKPLFGPLFAIPAHRAIRRALHYLLPLVTERKRQTASSASASASDRTWKAPEDTLQYLLNHASTHNLPAKETTAHNIASRLLVLNFAAIHTSTFTITNTIFDLLSSPAPAGLPPPPTPGPGEQSTSATLEGIAQEARTLLASTNNQWSKATIAKLHRADSVLRESLRYTGLFSRGLQRQVVAKEGITLPTGEHLPRGARLGCAVGPVHRDERFYENPERYEGFRFANEREVLSKGETGGEGKGKVSGEEVLKERNLSMVATSDRFMAFGHGRHSCPGRFFAANELKLLLTYIALNYDVQTLPVRPPNKVISEFTTPPMKATIKIRRKKGVSIM